MTTPREYYTLACKEYKQAEQNAEERRKTTYEIADKLYYDTMEAAFSAREQAFRTARAMQVTGHMHAGDN